MSLDFRLDSVSDGATLTVKLLSCETFFARIVDDAVMLIDYQLGGSYVSAVFTVTLCSEENLYGWFEDDSGIA